MTTFNMSAYLSVRHGLLKVPRVSHHHAELRIVGSKVNETGHVGLHRITVNVELTSILVPSPFGSLDTASLTASGY